MALISFDEFKKRRTAGESADDIFGSSTRSTAAPKQQKSTLPSFEEYSKMRRSGKSADEIFGSLGGSAGTQFRGRTDTNGKETAEELASKARESVIAFDENGDVNLWQTAVNTQKDAQAYAEAKERYWQQTATPEEKEKREMQRNPQSAEDIQKAWDLPYEVEEAPFWSWVLGHPVYKPKRGTTLAEIHGLDEKASAGDVINKTVQDAKDSANVAVKNLTDTSPTGNSYIDTWGERGVENAKAAQTLASTYGVATSALEGSLTQKSSEEYVDRYRNKTYGEKLAANVGITAANYGLDLANTLLTVSDTLSGGQLSSSDWGASIYRVANLYQNAGSELTSQAYASMRESSNWLGRLVLDIEKTLTEQGLDRLLGWGGGSLITMGARSFGAGAQESENRGEGRDKQITTGLVRAGVEIGTEMMSGVGGSWRGKGYGDAIFSKLDKFVASKTGSEFLGTLAQAFSSEAVEEMVSDILNPLFDRIFGIGEVTGRGEDKTFMQKLGHYFADVWGDGQILYDGLLGGIAGLGGGATTGIANSVGAHNLAVDVSTYKTAQRIAEDSSLKTRFEEFTGLQLADDSSDAITQIATYLTNIPTDENRGIKSRQIESDLENKITVPKAADLKTISKAEMASVFIGAREKLSQEGVTDGKLADAIAAVTLQEIADKKGAANRFAPSDRQQRLVNESELAQRIVRELEAESIVEESKSKVSAQDLRADVKVNGESAKIVGVGKGKVQVQQNGETKTVEAKELEGITDGYRTLIDLASSMEGGTEMLQAYNPGQNVKAYAIAWDRAYNLYGAQTEMTPEMARKYGGRSLAALTDTQLKMALDMGRERYNANKEKAEERGKQLKQAREEAEKRGTVKRKKGTVSYDGGEVNGVKYKGIDKKNLTVAQKRVVAMVEALADAVNIDYVLFEGEANTGGSYIQGGTIYINIKAGEYSGKTLGAATLSHELTHFLQDFAPEEYQQLKDFIISEILKQSPEQFERLVQKQIDLEPNLNYEQATDEMIANACQKMLLNSEAVTKLARQNMNLAEKIRDAISEISDKIKAAFADVDFSDNVPVFEAARAIENVMDRAQALWDKTLEAATENYNAAQATGMKAEGGVQYQAWDSGDLGRTFIDYSDETAFENAFIEKAKSLKSRSKVVKITAEEVSAMEANTDWNDIAVARKYIRKTLQTLFGENSVFFEDNGNVIEAYLTKDGRKHSAGAVTSPLKAAAMAKAHEFIANAEYVFSSEHTAHSEKGMNIPEETIWDYFEALGSYGGIDLPVRFSLRDIPTDVREQIYKIGINEENVSSNNRVQETGRLVDHEETSSNTSIADESAKSNTKNQQFQMLSPVEQTDKLVAVHNKSVSGLRRMLQRGGVPFPSIAIKKAGTPHEGFGDVSIVFPRSTIDPAESRWNRLYSNDAWTPTEPRTEYEVVDTWKLRQQMEEEMGTDAFRATQLGSYLEENQLARDLETSEGDIVRALKGRTGIKYAYLKSIGQEPEAARKEKPLDGFGRYKNAQLLAVFETIPAAELKAMNYDSTETLQKVADVLQQQFMDSLPSDAAKRFAERRAIYTADKINPQIIKDALRNYEASGGVMESEIDDVELNRVLRDNKTIEEDPRYQEWIRNRFGNLIRDSGISNGKGVYTDTGNRRSFKARHVPATLENIVAQMRKEQETGIGLGGINLRGAATKAYSSVEEMRQESGKLLGEHIFDEEYDSYMKEFGQRLNDLTEAATKTGYDVAKQTLLEAVRDSKNKNDMKRRLQNESRWIRYSDELTDDLWQLKQDVQNMPAPYFEAKPRRIVYPEEALAYILPDNADSDVLSELSDRGYNVLTYKAGDEADRLAKLNSVQGAQFQKLGIGETAEEQQARKESFDNLKAENKILRARAEYWKAQMRPTKERTVRQQDTDRLANELLKKYDSKADREDVKASIKALGDWLVQTNDLDYDELKAKAKAIAEDIVSGNYVLLDNSQQENLDRLKDYLKSTPVNLTKADFNDTGDENFRRKYGRYFTISDRGRTIDSLWGEMAAMFGEGIFPEDTYAPGDMLNMIADYLDMWKPQYGNAFEMYHQEAVDSATNEIIDAILSEDVRQSPDTYADKAQKKLNAQIAKDRERLNALREAKNARIEELKRQASEKNAQIRMAEKSAKYEAVSKVKQHYQDMIKKQRNKRSDTAVRAKIKKLHKELTDILLKPKEGRYVPKELVKATAEILGAIDTTSGRAIKAKAAFAELKVKYEELAKNDKYALAYDETISDMIQSLTESLGDGSIYDLTGTELEDVYNVLKALKHTIVTANKLVGAKIEADAFDAANQWMREIENAKGIPTKALRKFVMAQMTPSSFFRMAGGYVKNSMSEQLFDELNNGQLTQTQIMMEGGMIFRELIDDKKNMDKLHDKKNLVDIGLKDDMGNTVKITRGMMLSVYMHLLNEQNAKHVAYGGFTVPKIREYYANKMKDAYSGKTGRAVAFAAEIAELNEQLRNAESVEEQEEIKEKLADLQDQTDAYMSNLRSQIEEQLTEYDRKWIAAAQQFFDVFSKDKLNEVTEMVYGFSKARVNNYFPIHTDPNYRAASFDTIARDMSLENAGFMKERVNGANPIMLEDITDVIGSQLRRTAQYVGLMPAIRNFNKVYGKARAGYTMSVQSALNRTFENEGKNYIENLLADLNGARHQDADIFDMLRGNMAGAVLTLNPRVALSQTASYPTAAAEIGYKPLIKALKDIKNNPSWSETARDEVAKWTPLWWYRMQGFSTVELGDIKNNEQFMSKVMDKMKWATGWIQFMDGMTTGALWQASKYYVDDNFSDLEKGSDEYMMKVAEVYNRVIEKTQPDYTTMQRPDILRNPNKLYKQLTMFMTQRLQNTNILYDAAATYSHYVRDAAAGRNGVTSADVKQARTRLVWAVSSQVAASATIVIFKALADFIMHSLKAYRDDDDELTAESVSKTLLANFAETIISNMLWGSELYSALKSIVTGDRYYGISLNGVDTFKDLLEDGVKTLSKVWKGDWENAAAPAWKLAKAVAQFFGVPLGNMEKIAKMAANYFEDAKNGTFMEAGVDRTRAQNTHILFDALQRGDTAKASRIRAEFKGKKDEQAALKGYINEMYTGENQKINKAQTIIYLQKYCGMTKRDAESLALKWTMEVVTGIKYDDLKDEFLEGRVQRARAEKYLNAFGGLNTDEAAVKVTEWLSEKETGIAYSDIGNEVKTGRLSEEKAIQMLMKYGGKSRDAATKTVNGYAIERDYEIKPSELEEEYLSGNVYDREAMDILLRYKYYGKENAAEKAAEDLERMRFVKANPDAADMSITQVRNYKASGLSGVVSAADYLRAAKMMGTFSGEDKNGDGKTDRDSVAKQKLAYIDTLHITKEQKTALALALGISERTIRKYAAWRK